MEYKLKEIESGSTEIQLKGSIILNNKFQNLIAERVESLKFLKVNKLKHSKAFKLFGGFIKKNIDKNNDKNEKQTQKA